MRQMLMCVVAIFGLTSACFSQGNSATYETLTIQTFDENGQLLQQQNLKDQEAVNFDVPLFLQAELDASRIKIRGTFYNDSQVEQIKFDSGTIAEEDKGSSYCEASSFTVKPFLGVSAYSRDDFNGVNIERIVENSPADQAGLMINDVILTFNGLFIETFCDLKLEIGRCEVGQVVPVEMIKGGKQLTQDVTIGGQLTETVNYHICDDQLISPGIAEETKLYQNVDMRVFPNPSSGTSNLNFMSSSLKPIKFYVLDINGGIVYKEDFKVFDGNLKTIYNFDNVADGTYLFLIEQDGQVYKEQVVYTK